MKNKIYIGLFLGICVFGCKEIKPRRPKDHSTKNFYKEVIEQNKKLNALEKSKIELFLKADTLQNYHVSPIGLWYTYIEKDTLNSEKPIKGDIVKVQYNITDMNNNIIYVPKTTSYVIDKEDFVPGLQDGIKLMKKGETITFVIPSYRGYGVTGDGDRIGINQPIKSTLTLIEIKKPNNEVK